MVVRPYRLFALLFCTVTLTLLGLCGCHSRQACGDAWDSPTIRGTRALLVVPADELEILRIDGRNVRSSQISETHGLREYMIPAGTHTLTAVFRYAAPVSGNLLGEVRGHPLKLKQFFHAGREYAAVYRIHPYERRKPRWLLEGIAYTLFTPVDYYWSLDVVDLAEWGKVLAQGRQDERVEVGPRLRQQLRDYHADVAEDVATVLSERRHLAPEVRNALLYRSFPREMDETVSEAEMKLSYRTRFTR